MVTCTDRAYANILPVTKRARSVLFRDPSKMVEGSIVKRSVFETYLASNDLWMADMVRSSHPAKEDHPTVTADPHAQDAAGPQVPTFQDVLGLLLKAQAKENPNKPGEFIEPTNTEVAEAINTRFGPGTITNEHIRRLRNGTVKNPGIEIASILADFFDLPLDVFKATGSETSRKVVEEVQRFLGARRPTLSEEPEPPAVRVLARTTRRLSPAGQARVARYAEQVAQLEAMESETGTFPVVPSTD
ncbi:hypothetical protein ACIQVK_44345 [Streptomyces sp. NPDC090493]|uniref:hypothetical protein n=1 Tax=Streptomyces sp. NPDC090493 TaxID=3365964 RepID=UPI0038215314